MEYIKNFQNDMLDYLAKLVSYNSVEGAAKENMPFGRTVAECLECALGIAQELGLETHNLDNYCGWAQIGEGKDIIGIAAHLDIVPAGEGWETNPFVLTRKGDVVYGRGVSDDKGAVIASLFALKILKESGIPLNKRIRLIMGCNEETGSKCMKYYSSHAEPIWMGFTPDGDFPGIYGEKGMCSLTAYSKNTKIISMNGGFVSNAVMPRCVTEIPCDSVDIDVLKTQLANTDLTDFTVEKDGEKITITAIGRAAHASTPHLGVNAAGCTMSALQNAGFKDDFVEFYMSHIGVDGCGKGLGCDFADEYGDLTLCNGMVTTENNTISCTLDIRYPVTLNNEKLRDMLTPNLEDENGKIVICSMVEPLFFKPDSLLVKKLHDAYVTVTGDTVNRPKVIGGGTYAKSLKGIIAFGCEFPGDNNHIHDANESLKINDLMLQTKIYIEAIKNLLQ